MNNPNKGEFHQNKNYRIRNRIIDYQFPKILFDIKFICYRFFIMNNIIIDTNIIYLDFKLRNARIVSLCDTADILGHKVYIPEVVIDEARPSGFIIRRL